MTNADNANDLFHEAMSELMNSNFEKSMALLTASLENDATDKLAYIGRGSVFMKLNQASEAIEDFNKALEIDPNYPKALHLRGLAREKLGEDDLAKADFDRAIELDPDYGAAYYSRATLLTKLGQADLALEDMGIVTHLTNRNIEEFANNNNVWRSHHLKLESMGVASEMER